MQCLAALHMKKRCNMEMWENVRWLVFRYIGSLLSTCLAAVMFAFKYSQLVPKQLVTHVQYITHTPQQTWHPTGRAVYKNTAACIPKQPNGTILDNLSNILHHWAVQPPTFSATKSFTSFLDLLVSFFKKNYKRNITNCQSIKYKVTPAHSAETSALSWYSFRNSVEKQKRYKTFTNETIHN